MLVFYFQFDAKSSILQTGWHYILSNLFAYIFQMAGFCEATAPAVLFAPSRICVTISFFIAAP